MSIIQTDDGKWGLKEEGGDPGFDTREEVVSWIREFDYLDHLSLSDLTPDELDEKLSELISRYEKLMCDSRELATVLASDANLYPADVWTDIIQSNILVGVVNDLSGAGDRVLDYVARKREDNI